MHRRKQLANSAALTSLQANKKKLINYMNFVIAFIRKKAKPKASINQALASLQELFSLKEKLKKIQYRINYEKYKLKKTELILAQNQDHVFIKGRKLNQTR